MKQPGYEVRVLAVVILHVESEGQGLLSCSLLLGTKKSNFIVVFFFFVHRERKVTPEIKVSYLL